MILSIIHPLLLHYEGLGAVVRRSCCSVPSLANDGQPPGWQAHVQQQQRIRPIFDTQQRQLDSSQRSLQEPIELLRFHAIVK